MMGAHLPRFQHHPIYCAAVTPQTLIKATKPNTVGKITLIISFPFQAAVSAAVCAAVACCRCDHLSS